MPLGELVIVLLFRLIPFTSLSLSFCSVSALAFGFLFVEPEVPRGYENAVKSCHG